MLTTLGATEVEVFMGWLDVFPPLLLSWFIISGIIINIYGIFFIVFWALIKMQEAIRLWWYGRHKR